MKVTFKKSKSGQGWFAYDDKGDLIDYFFTKWGAIHGVKKHLKRKKTGRQSFEMEIA
jgi:hypothetical protein